MWVFFSSLSKLERKKNGVLRVIYYKIFLEIYNSIIRKKLLCIKNSETQFVFIWNIYKKYIQLFHENTCILSNKYF